MNQQLRARLLDLLTGDMLPVPMPNDQERYDQMVADAVCKHTGLGLEVWRQLNEAERVYWMEKAADLLLHRQQVRLGIIRDLVQNRDVAQDEAHDEHAWSEPKAPTDWRKELGITEKVMRRLEQEGILVIDKISKSLWRIRIDTLERFKATK